MKRNKWVRALFPFFRDHGLIGFSMEDVSDYLKVSKATIYNYFKSKEEIIDCYLQEKLKDLDGFNELISDESSSITERYENSLFHLLVHFNDLSPQVRHDLQFMFPDKWARLNRAVDGFMAEIAILFNRGIAAEVFHAINPELLVICDRNMLFYLSDQKQVNGSGLTLEQAFNEYMYMRRNGLLKLA